MATLSQNLLATAELLANAKPSLGSAALRRAVSTAYYALFSRLSALCAHRLSRADTRSDSFKSVYRAIDHGYARTVLATHPEFGSPVGDAFKRLQEARHWADYSADLHPEADKGIAGKRFTQAEALRFVRLARDAIEQVDALAPEARQRLAVALITRTRK